MTQKTPSLEGGGVFMFQCFVSFLILAFSCLTFSSFPVPFDLLKPKTGPSDEVIGNSFFGGVPLLENAGRRAPPPSTERMRGLALKYFLLGAL